jgi:hypothetical protein
LPATILCPGLEHFPAKWPPGQFIYVDDTNQLWFDRDGTGSGHAPIHIATVGIGDIEPERTTLVEGDFFLIA